MRQEPVGLPGRDLALGRPRAAAIRAPAEAAVRGGAAVVFSSAELDEIVSVSDRVLVFFNGRMVADMSSAAIDPNLLGNAIAGAV